MHRRRKVDARRTTALRRGFTLIEVLLVLAILGVIAAMVVPNLLGQQKKAMINATKSSIHGVEKALEIYAVEHNGEYPDGGQEVFDMLLKTQEVNGVTEGPYLKEPPRDAWGNVLYYQYPPKNQQTTDKPDIWSSGPKGADDGGSGDDINNWTQDQL